MRMKIALVACLPALFAAAVSAVEMPAGYRMQHYRAATPTSVPGGVVVDADQVQTLQEAGALLVDVMGADQFATPGLEGEWLVHKRHDTIPGAVWLPNVGRGHLAPGIERFFRVNLHRLTAGNRHHALVFFCVPDCWMAWNATKRAAVMGYTHLYWYRAGTSDWRTAGHDLTAAEPVPLAKPD